MQNWLGIEMRFKKPVKPHSKSGGLGWDGTWRPGIEEGGGERSKRVEGSRPGEACDTACQREGRGKWDLVVCWEGEQEGSSGKE